MMQTTSSRRVVQKEQTTKTSSSESSSPKVTYNKENNGSDSESFSQGVTQTIVRAKASSSTVAKKVMTASELLAKQGWSKQHIAAPKNETTSPPSYDMKYSSVSPPEQRCPSARTITNQCFTFDESVDEGSLSPESFRIMEEMNTVYETSPMASSYIKSPSKKNSSYMDEVDSVYKNSPIPSTYINSPSKMSSAEEVNSVYENSPIQSKRTAISREEKNVSKQQSVVPKKRMDASTWLNKSQPKVRSTKAMMASGISPSTAKAYGASTTNRSLSSAGASSKKKGRGNNDHSRRSSFSAPNNNRSVTKGQPVALAAQREKQQRQKLSAEADSTNETRTCLDKRTARLRYGKDFKADILQHRQQQPYLNNGTNHSEKVGGQIHERSVNGVSIVVRKRPMFDFEQNRGDYDVVSIDQSSSEKSSAVDTCIIDNCVMHPDMKTKLVKPLFFSAQAAFDEHCSNDDVYRNIAEPLVNSTVKEGIVATLLLYGQTGCGKSYTMSGIEERTAKGIFQAIASLHASKDYDDDGTADDTAQGVTLQFVELCGSKEIKDLLVARPKEVVKLLDDEDGICRLLNATSIDITSPEHLLQKIAEGKSRRATEATDKNGVSSRSHAVCQIRIKGSKGVLTLIDLAGSERRGDALYHTQERQKESAEINASLFALKECVRARASNSSRVPFRNHNLTRILRESFERDSKLCVIAAISPNATDTEHSVETLRFATSIVGTDSSVGETRIVVPVIKTLESRDILPPKQWDNAQLKKFLNRKKMDMVQLTDKHDGKVLMKMSVQQMRTQLFDDKDSELAKKLFDLLRLENDKIDKLQRADRMKLSKARKGQS
jgi:kinesin family protein 2/24